jgi:hypothetical protein
MAKTTKQSASSKKTVSKAQLIQAYMDRCLEHGCPPPSVFQFMKNLGIAETIFYQNFGSFAGLENEFWVDRFQKTLETLSSDDTYNTFSMREKLLAFYFTLFEMLSSDRSFILLILKDWKDKNLFPKNTEQLKKSFLAFINELIVFGIESGEIADRKYLTNKYDQGFWLQYLFVLRFWIKDASPGFETTDAAIEKAVNLSMEFIGRGPLETMMDFAKFLIHNR